LARVVHLVELVELLELAVQLCDRIAGSSFKLNGLYSHVVQLLYLTMTISSCI